MTQKELCARNVSAALRETKNAFNAADNTGEVSDAVRQKLARLVEGLNLVSEELRQD